jgi:hypothetical protein
MKNRVDSEVKAKSEAAKLYAHASQPENVGNGPGLVREFTVDSILEFWEESQEAVPKRLALSTSALEKLEPLVRKELVQLGVPL